MWENKDISYSFNFRIYWQFIQTLPSCIQYWSSCFLECDTMKSGKKISMFLRTCFLHLHGRRGFSALKMDAASSSKMLYLSTRLHGITSQNTVILILITERTSDLTYKNNSHIPRLQIVKQLVTPIPHTQIRLQIVKSHMRFDTVLHKTGNKRRTSSRRKISEMKRSKKGEVNAILMPHIQKTGVLGEYTEKTSSVQQEYVNTKLMEPWDSMKFRLLMPWKCEKFSILRKFNFVKIIPIVMTLFFV